MLSLHGGWLVVFRGKTIACLVCFRTSLTAEKVTLTVTGPRLIVAYVWSCIPEIVALLASLPLEKWFVHCLSCRLKYRYQNAGPGVRFANNNNRASLGADFVQRGVHVFVYADANKIQLSQGNRRNLIHPFMYVSAYRHTGMQDVGSCRENQLYPEMEKVKEKDQFGQEPHVAVLPMINDSIVTFWASRKTGCDCRGLHLEPKDRQHKHQHRYRCHR